MNNYDGEYRRQEAPRSRRMYNVESDSYTVRQIAEDAKNFEYYSGSEYTYQRQSGGKSHSHVKKKGSEYQPPREDRVIREVRGGRTVTPGTHRAYDQDMDSTVSYRPVVQPTASPSRPRTQQELTQDVYQRETRQYREMRATGTSSRPAAPQARPVESQHLRREGQQETYGQPRQPASVRNYPAEYDTPVRESGKGGGHRGGQQPPKKKGCLKKILIAFLIMLAVLAAIALVLKFFVIKPPEVSTDIGGRSEVVDDNTPTMAPQKTEDGVETNGRKKDVYSFMVIGMDDGNGNTDTMMLATYDVPNQKLNVVSIPRDTLCNVSWNVKKANTLYSMGDIEGLMDGIGDLCGFTPDFYVKVNLQAFEVLVDAIGGVWFDVPCDMDYEDPSQDLYIHVSGGEQYLDGATAVGVMRFRSGYANADIGRIGTQQAFLKTAASQILSNVGSIDIGTLARVFLDYVDTDLSYGNLMWLGAQFLKMDQNNINFYTLPGNYGDYVYEVSYVTVDVPQWLELLNAYMNPFERLLTESDLDILTRNEWGEIYATSGVYAGESWWGN